MDHGLTLGCGLIRLGRPWGVPEKEALSIDSSRAFLAAAVANGIRFFDTAPAYGLSEERLGSFLLDLDDKKRSTLVIATKFGEHWDPATGTTFVDHSTKRATESIRRSVDLLGSIDILQVHKCTTEVLRSPELEASLRFATEQGVQALGASVSDVKTLYAVLADERFTYVQFPLNAERPDFMESVGRVPGRFTCIANRPYAMGKLALNGENTRVEALRLVCRHLRRGIVLTGTADQSHLAENVAAFKVVCGARPI